MWEGLLTLLVVSLILHALLMSTSTFKHVRDQESQDRTAEALTFMELLERELEAGKVRKITSQEIQLLGKQQVFRINLRNGKIYKSPGHHPYLLDVASWYLIDQGQKVLIEVILKNGQSFSGVVPYEK